MTLTGDSDLRVTIAHEWLTVIGGSDKTVRAMVDAFPRARVVVPIVDPATVEALLPGTNVQTLWPNRLPGAQTNWRRYFPAVIAAWSMLRLFDTDVLVSSSHFAAKAAGTRFDGVHLCYCYTPMRVAWRPDLELGRLRPSLRPVAHAVLPLVRRWDRSTVERVTSFAAISSSVADRIREFYGRDATVLFPPVDVDPFLTSPRRAAGDYLLTFGRLVPYKRFDLAVEAATRFGYDLVVAGSGPDEARLRSIAGPSVRFTGWVDDEEYRRLLAGAAALLFPGEEDFGIVPVEALAAGCPVIALASGGALDTVRPGENGVFFGEPSVEALRDAIEVARTALWNETTIRDSSRRFSHDRFVTEFREFVRNETARACNNG